MIMVVMMVVAAMVVVMMVVMVVVFSLLKHIFQVTVGSKIRDHPYYIFNVLQK